LSGCRRDAGVSSKSLIVTFEEELRNLGEQSSRYQTADSWQREE
jgi:hypothetical protein